MGTSPFPLQLVARGRGAERPPQCRGSLPTRTCHMMLSAFLGNTTAHAEAALLLGPLAKLSPHDLGGGIAMAGLLPRTEFAYVRRFSQRGMAGWSEKAVASWEKGGHSG